MEHELVVASSGLGRVAVSTHAVEQIVGLAIELRVVVEHGLKLAEVATAVRERVLYELERMVGLPVAEPEVHIERVRAR